MNLQANPKWRGYLRPDGRKGIRNLVAIAYLVECAHHVVREISDRFQDAPVHIIGFGGCYPNGYADAMMNRLCTHPNIGGVLLVSLGCESFNRNRLLENIRASGRPAELIVIQSSGGTRKSIEEGIRLTESLLERIQSVPQTDMDVSDLVVGAVAGGSDATSGITSNPAVGRAFDKLADLGATALFENTGEMIGLEDMLSRRGVTTALQSELKRVVEKAASYYAIMGHGSFAPGNAMGGLTTLEEKSMGAYLKSGSRKIEGILKPGDIPHRKGVFLMDIVPDGAPRFGFPNPNDSSEIIELIASGAHCVLFTTGRGSVVGSAISPVLKICANPDTFSRMKDDMDVNAGTILSEGASVDAVADEIMQKICEVAGGRQSCSEQLRHREFVLGYKTFEPAGPACLP